MSSPGISSLPRRVLCLVTDVELADGADRLLRVCESAVRGGVNMVQVRAHDLDETELAVLAKRIIGVVEGRAVVVVNGSLEAAVAAGADGVHLPEKTSDAAGIAASAHENGMLVGRSVHSAESAAEAVSDGVDYLVMGTVFASRSHPGGPVCGPGGVKQAVEAAKGVPVIGIGGITAQNAADVIEAGASGVAVIGAIIGAPDPQGAAKLISAAIELS